MKKIMYKITVLVLIAGAIASCDDQLDQLPFDSFATDNAFITAEDFENGIRGVYLGLTAGGYYGSSDAGSLLSAPDVMSDNVTLAQNGRRSKETLHNFQYSASTTNLGNLYASCYSLIYRANQVLFYTDTYSGSNKANIEAEAKALRAMAHFDLVKTFGKIPTQAGDANGSLGVAYVTTADPNIEPPRETVGAVYDKIVADLTDAAAGINATNPPGRMGRDAVNLLLSRVYLYMGQWQNAISAASLVTTPIAPRSSVVGVWQDANQAGLLFYIPNDETGLNQSIGVTWSQGSTSNLIAEYVASFELFNTYAADDIRKEAYIISAQRTLPGGVVVNYNGIRKLLGKNGAFNGRVDYKIFRAAEAQLNIAEAQFNLGNEAAATAALDAVRTKRYTTPPSGETGSALNDAIRLERRLEFAFEYQRFYDIKRWGLSIQRDGNGEFADGSGTPSEVQSLSAGSNKFQLPIDQSILDRNPNTAQNPGY